MDRRAVVGYLLVLVAASLWATIGLFYRALLVDFSLSRQTVVAYRAGLAAVSLFVWFGLRHRRLPTVRRRDWPFFLLFGTVGVAGFYLAYVAAIGSGSVAQAAVLLYTAPFWIMGWSVVAEHARLDGWRVGALLLAFVGCALVAGASNPAALQGNALSIVWGLGSGLGYAVYSVCSSHGTRRGYSPVEVVVVSLGLGSIVLFAAAPWHDVARAATTPAIWPWLLAVAVFPTLLAPLCFTIGLQRVATANASIIATLEPVIAAGLAAAFLGEHLTAPQLVGGACVLTAVVVLTLQERRVPATPRSTHETVP